MWMPPLAIGTLAVCIVLGLARSVWDFGTLAHELFSSVAKPRPAQFTLGRVMAAIAGLALAFAFLPTLLSVAFVVTVLGILVLEGLRRAC